MSFLQRNKYLYTLRQHEWKIIRAKVAGLIFNNPIWKSWFLTYECSTTGLWVILTLFLRITHNHFQIPYVIFFVLNGYSMMPKIIQILVLTLVIRYLSFYIWHAIWRRSSLEYLISRQIKKVIILFCADSLHDTIFLN